MGTREAVRETLQSTSCAGRAAMGARRGRDRVMRCMYYTWSAPTQRKSRAHQQGACRGLAACLPFLLLGCCPCRAQDIDLPYEKLWWEMWIDTNVRGKTFYLWTNDNSEKAKTTYQYDFDAMFLWIKFTGLGDPFGQTDSYTVVVRGRSVLSRSWCIFIVCYIKQWHLR